MNDSPVVLGSVSQASPALRHFLGIFAGNQLVPRQQQVLQSMSTVHPHTQALCLSFTVSVLMAHKPWACLVRAVLKYFMCFWCIINSTLKKSQFAIAPC